jgi:sulfoxide reductase heme-binding subunit YedZ
MSKPFIDALWYLARGTGVACLSLLTVVVILGIGSRSGREIFGLPRFAVSAIHRNASLMALALLGIHVTSLLLDPYAQLRIVDLVVPFGAAYRPAWVGLGTLAADLVVAVVVTSLLRHRLGVRAWRTVHWAAYGLWPAAWLHGLLSGTDGGQLWLRGVVVLCAAAVGGAVAWRLIPTFAETARTRA